MITQKKIEYKVGYNYDPSLIDVMANLNSMRESVKIKSVYASSSEFDWLTARPKYRLPIISLQEIQKHIALLHKANIKFFYALNASYAGSKAELSEREASIIDFIRRLEDISVDGVIVTHPFIAELVSGYSNMEITLSSITNTFSVNQIEVWRQLYGIHSFCLSPYFNREIRRLAEIQKKIAMNSCELELIVNELCGLGFSSGKGAAPCIFRDSCFLCHSENITRDDDNLINGFPQAICIKNRDDCEGLFWSKLKFIRPEDVPRYAEVGVHKFKITGRTATTKELVRVLKAYMIFSFDGDVSELWYMSGKKRTVNNKELDGMADFWFSQRGHSCEDELCGVTCKYCDSFLKGRGIS